MKVAIAFLTKDRIELSRQTIQPLLGGKFDMWWVDGSATEGGQELPLQEGPPGCKVHGNVTGGPDAAAVYALTMMLAAPEKYDYVGLCENDVLLHPDWFGPTFALFERGKAEGLEVGAVSARCYEDRVLIQRDGYAICHNLGWGMQIMSRRAAKLTLRHYRTHHTIENRRVFLRLSGVDISRYWAFRDNYHAIVADWGNDRVLAQYGMASLALTPSPVEMIGQVPPLAEQGLKLVSEPVELLRSDAAFATYRDNLQRIRLREWHLPVELFDRNAAGQVTIYPHQIRYLNGRYYGEWSLKWMQGHGPFAFQAQEAGAYLRVCVGGACHFLVSGGDDVGQVEVQDESGSYSFQPYHVASEKTGQVLAVGMPEGGAYREVALIAKTKGTTFYGMYVAEPQPVVTHIQFDHSWLSHA